MRHEIAVIGAGPYGLAAAAHLRNAGLEVKVFGEAMAFWDRQMPAGMLLRSPRSASHIADPLRQLTLDDYERSEQVTLNAPIELRRFVEYGRWFQRRVAPDLDTRPVERVEPAGDGFRVTVEGGDQVEAGRIIVAAGIASFAWSPPPFGSLPRELVSHSSAERDLHRFAGRRVLVVGGGQSALETAALLHEAGAKTEVVVRRPAVTWLDQRAGWLKHEANPLRPLLYPPSDIGPPVLNRMVASPGFFARLPRGLQDRIARRCIRPAGSAWLRPRLAAVPITTGRFVVTALPRGRSLQLTLDDGNVREVDHVIAATGYRVDIAKYGFLSRELLQNVSRVGGYPVLTPGFESSVPGLHFIGAAAAYSLGPLFRFVAGTAYTGAALGRCGWRSRMPGRRYRPGPRVAEAEPATLSP